MHSTDAWALAAIGFCLGLGVREVTASWATLVRDAFIRDARPVAPKAEASPAVADDAGCPVRAWSELNPWYATDPVLSMEAQIIFTALTRREPHLSFERGLAEVTAEMHRRHPEIVPTRQ